MFEIENKQKLQSLLDQIHKLEDENLKYENILTLKKICKALMCDENTLQNSFIYTHNMVEHYIVNIFMLTMCDNQIAFNTIILDRDDIYSMGDLDELRPNFEF